MSDEITRLQVQSEQTHAMVTELHAHVCGSPGVDGLSTRVAKVEQRQSLIMKICGVIGGAFVSTIAAVTLWIFRSK